MTDTFTKDQIIFDSEQKSITTRLGDADGVAQADVKVGGSDPSKFLPNVNISKWDDECWINLNAEDVVVDGKETVVTAAGKYTVEFTKLDMSYKVEDSPVANYNKGLGWGIILKQRPTGDRIRLRVTDSGGLVYGQVPALAEQWATEKILRDYHKTFEAFEAHQAENFPRAVGSITVHCNKRHGKYRTGKVGHIYAPSATDGLERKLKLPLKMDKSQPDYIDVEIDSKWLDEAVYPIVINDTIHIGEDAQGGSGSIANLCMNLTGYSSGETGGTATFCRTYTSGTPDDVSSGYYPGWTGSNLVRTDEETVTGTNGGWTESEVTGDIVASTEYVPACSSSMSIAYDFSGANFYYASLQIPIPDPWNILADDSTSIEASVYIEYEETAVIAIHQGAWQNTIHQGAWQDGVAAEGAASAALTGTLVSGGVLESEIVTGGETLIITLTDDTFIAAGTGPIGTTANTQALIDGIDGDVAGGTGWDAQVKANLVPADDVERTSNTVCTVTTNAAASYAISSDETITVTIPAAVLTGGEEIVADATFVITNESAGISVPVASHHFTKNILSGR